MSVIEWYGSMHRYDLCTDIYRTMHMQTTKDPTPMKEWHKTECLYDYESWHNVTGTPRLHAVPVFSELWSWIFTPNYQDYVLEHYGKH